jgi:hypothetical protein
MAGHPTPSSRDVPADNERQGILFLAWQAPRSGRAGPTKYGLCSRNFPAKGIECTNASRFRSRGALNRVKPLTVALKFSALAF